MSPRIPLARRTVILLALLLATAGTGMVAAMLRTSTTFDEIVMIAAGARGYHTGQWSMAPEHPPVVQYLYGLPAYIAHPNYPDESRVPASIRANPLYRYLYAEDFFWRAGNDPEKLAFVGRLPGVLCGLALILLVFFYARSLCGDGAALLAASLTAFLPDVLAHSGVAYNDVPLALTFVSAIWAIDRAIRSPSFLRSVAAGALIGLALGVKNSALALAPIAVTLLVWEAALHFRETIWRIEILKVILITSTSAYIALALVYRGDFALIDFSYTLVYAFKHVKVSPVPAFLLEKTSMHGWWYFYPVAFLYKTSAGLHLLMVVALGHFLTRLRAPYAALRSNLRAPAAALLIFGALLINSNVALGFRYALPSLPLLCILVAAGVVPVWKRAAPILRMVIIASGVWAVIHVASYYPFFLSYISEYGPGRDENHHVLVDSNLDWGQGLLELRKFMRENHIPGVYLSYFGSAIPEGYGINYATLDSFFELQPQPPLKSEPKWVAISATNLEGIYIGRERFKAFRAERPDRVLAGSILLYQIRNPPR